MTNAVTGELGATLCSFTRGQRLEQFIVTQLKAALSWPGVQVDLRFWRNHSGAEVDWLLCRGQKVQALPWQKFFEGLPDLVE